MQLLALRQLLRYKQNKAHFYRLFP
jgi:hypothetical protein